MKTRFEFLNRKLIVPGHFRLRKEIFSASFQNLVESIGHIGIIEPVVVRPKNNEFELIVGERRALASVRAGVSSIPAIIIDEDVSDLELLGMMLTENIHRLDLEPMEKANAYQAWIDAYIKEHPGEKNKSKEYFYSLLARAINKSVSYIETTLRLRGLYSPVKKHIGSEKGKIKKTTALKIARVKDKKAQEEIAHKAITEELTAQQVQERVNRMLALCRKDKLSQKRVADSLDSQLRAKLANLQYFQNINRNCSKLVNTLYKSDPGHLVRIRTYVEDCISYLNELLKEIDAVMKKERKRQEQIKQQGVEL